MPENKAASSGTTFDPTKPVRTRDGKPARILCTDARGDLPIVALVGAPGESEYVQRFTKDGCAYRNVPLPHDLINVPEKRTLDIWVNIYSDEDDIATCFPSVALARKWAHRDRVSCVHIVHEYVVGEGMT